MTESRTQHLQNIVDALPDRWWSLEARDLADALLRAAPTSGSRTRQLDAALDALPEHWRGLTAWEVAEALLVPLRSHPSPKKVRMGPGSEPPSRAASDSGRTCPGASAEEASPFRAIGSSRATGIRA